MEQPNTPQVDQVPGAEPVTEEEKAVAAEAAKTAEAAVTAEAAQAAEKTAQEAKTAAEAAKATADAAATPRTYTQEEWEKRESSKDQEISTYKQTASQAAMQVQIAQQQQAEANARIKDQGEVDQGQITQEQATQRQQGRQQAQQRAAQMQPKMEQLGRMGAAQDFGERYGVNPYELLSDQTITSPEQMETKAKQLGKAKSDSAAQVKSDELDTLKARIKALEEGDPQFDAGQQAAGSSVNLDELSPSELTAEAYSKREVAKRAKSRNK